MDSEAQDLAKDLVGRKTRIRELEARVEEIEAGIAALIERLEKNEKAAAEHGDAETANAYKAAAQMAREQFPNMVDAESDRAPDIVEDLFELQERVEELEKERDYLMDQCKMALDLLPHPHTEMGHEKAIRAGRSELQEGLNFVRCDHEWVTESTQTRSAGSPSQFHDPSPEYEQTDVICKYCGVSREDSHD